MLCEFAGDKSRKFVRCIGRLRPWNRDDTALHQHRLASSVSLQDRLGPWRGLLILVFLVAAGLSLARTEALTVVAGLSAVLYGLLAVVLLQFTVGNVWAYAVEYRDAGGAWSDLPFLAPVVFGAGWGVFAFSTTRSLSVAAWAAFWGFAVVAAITAVAVWVLFGYREDSEPSG